MIGYLLRIDGAYIGHAQHVNQELRKLIAFGLKRFRFIQVYVIVLEQIWIMMNHIRAGAGRRHNKVAVVKSVQYRLGTDASIIPITTVVGRLAAASLDFREFQLHAVPCQQSCHRFSHPREQGIAETSDK